MRWQVTIRDPQNAIPDLVLETFGDQGYSRSVVQQVNLVGFLATGGAQITGSRVKARYTWQLATDLTDAEALQLEAMALEQDRRYVAGQDGHLLLIDEVEFLPPESTPSKTLLNGSSVVTGYGMTYGFGIFKVKLNLPEQHRSHQGRDGLIQRKLIQIGATELPEVPV